MKIRKILKLLKEYNITGISDDTRYLNPGDLFISHSGSTYRGIEFIDQAIKLGARAILTDIKLEGYQLPIIYTSDAKEVLYPLVAAFYKYPWKKLKLIGITGTDGKTTTATFCEYLLSNKSNVAYIGTNGIRYQNNHIKTSYTTLPYCLFVKTLKLFLDNKIKYVCMEVSSQGIVNNRIKDIGFDVAVFTNLTHEHLDTHKTMDNYFEAKHQLFKQLKKNGIGIVNNDSPYAKKINCKKISFGLLGQSDYQANNITTLAERSMFDLVSNNRLLKNLETNLIETYNIYNLLAAIIVALHFKIPFSVIEESIKNMPKIDGRLEKIPTNKKFDIYVDFAHTPNALKELLVNLRLRTKQRIILVCGSAGRKDKTKRPILGKVAVKYADYVIFTSEDPRNENPLTIINEMISNITSNNYEIIIDRKDAIKKAIKQAKDGDIVIVSGKGNDDYFEINNQKLEYSDSKTILELLNEESK